MYIYIYLCIYIYIASTVPVAVAQVKLADLVPLCIATGAGARTTKRSCVRCCKTLAATSASTLAECT